MRMRRLVKVHTTGRNLKRDVAQAVWDAQTWEQRIPYTLTGKGKKASEGWEKRVGKP